MGITSGLRRTIAIARDRTSTICAGRTRSWGETADRVARIAGAFRALGVEDGDRVALLTLNSDRYIEFYLATPWAGAVIVPLNIRWSRAENADAIEDCGASLLIVDDAFAEMGRAIAAASGSQFALIYAGDEPAPEDMPHIEDLIRNHDPIPDAERSGDDLFGIFYTGGTTGRSKGVMLSHENIITNGLHVLAEGMFPDGTVYLHSAPMFHLADGAATFSLLMKGEPHVIVPSFTPEGVMKAIQEHKVTAALLVPTMIQMLVDHPAIGNYDLSSLKRIIYGAAPITEAVLDRATAKLPGVEFMQAYGMTELSPVATLLHPQEHVGESRAKGRHRSAGRAVIGCEVRIVDADDRPVPVGEVGEVVVRGRNVMMGYWERPEETAKAIVDGWMHTGDGARMDEDGFIYIVDRVKDMIISGGENVYSLEVENVVARHPDVAQCAVIGIPDEHWGEIVHAVVVPKSDARPTAEEIIAFCKQHIAGYKCPRSVEIRDEPLPMSGAGKILKRDLRKPYWEGRDRRVN